MILLLFACELRPEPVDRPPAETAEEDDPVVLEPDARTLVVEVRFSRAYDSLELMLETEEDSTWNPADWDDSSDRNSVFGQVDYPGYGELKLNVELDRAPYYAYYNDDARRCGELPEFVRVHGVTVSVESRDWSGGTNPDRDEGCDGYVSAREIARALR